MERRRERSIDEGNEVRKDGGMGRGGREGSVRGREGREEEECWKSRWSEGTY